MYNQTRRRNDFLVRCWVVFVIGLIYLPIVCSALASLLMEYLVRGRMG